MGVRVAIVLTPLLFLAVHTSGLQLQLRSQYLPPRQHPLHQGPHAQLAGDAQGLVQQGHGLLAVAWVVAFKQQIVAEYNSEPFKPGEPLILISIGQSYEEEGRSIYDAVRYAWKINADRAKGLLVLAHRRGLVLGAFRPKKWMKATRENFPRLESDMPDRWGFVGEYEEGKTASIYVGKRVPDEYRAKGASNPIRFVNP